MAHTAAGGDLVCGCMAGALLWQADKGAEVFSSLTLKQAGGSKLGLLLGTQDGRSVCLDASDGSEMWTHHSASGAGILSAAGELAQPQLFLLKGLNARNPPLAFAGIWPDVTTPGGGESCCHVVSCSNDGVVSVLEADPFMETVKLRAEVVLPAHVFSSPVLLGSMLVVGCRDDHLYCLEL